MNQRTNETFVAFLITRGYAKRTIQIYSEALENIPDTWETNDPKILYEHINNVLKKPSPTMSSTNIKNFRASIKQYFCLKTGLIYKDYDYKINHQSCYDNILNDFSIYSTDFKRISLNTTKSECQHIKKFLNYHGDITYELLSKLEAHDIRDYVCSVFQNLKTSSIGVYITSLRNFFRFLEYKGYPINRSLTELPLAPADWVKGSVPVILTNDEEKRLRNHHPANRKNNYRNRVIILLMLDLGLRCSEVSNLKLSDFLWSKGTVKIHNTKSEHARELPIPSNLGHLIESYIQLERPKQKMDILLIRIYLQSYVVMDISCVRRVIRDAFKKENIFGWWKGTHALRRTAASRIYNSGVGLKLTADFLGHKSLESTTAYIKVDFDSLREVAAPWPGGDYNA